MSRYRIEDPLGEGAMGKVYRAFDTSLERTVAMKVLKQTSSDVVRKRFIREARVASSLSHPNLIAVYDVGEDEEQRLYLVMELIEGESLAQIMERGEEELPHLMELLERVARGVHHAHEKGIIHRDLKPANIMIEKSGVAKVADFGLAHLMQSESMLTRTGSSLGTPVYMSPEQAKGLNKEIDARSDVYSLGVILYEMATGRLPFLANSVMELYRKIIEVKPTAPRSVNPDIDPDLEKIIIKALRKRPRKRFASAKEFADALRSHLLGRSINLQSSADMAAAKPRKREARVEPAPAGASSAKVWVLGVLAAGGIVISILLAILVMKQNAVESPTSSPVARGVPPPPPGPTVAPPENPTVGHVMAFRDIWPKVVEPLKDLEDSFHRSKLVDISKKKMDVEDALAAGQQRHPTSGVTVSIRALVRFYESRKTDALTGARPGVDPTPGLVLAHGFLQAYVAGLSMQNPPIWGGKPPAAALKETPEHEALRQAALEALDRSSRGLEEYEEGKRVGAVRAALMSFAAGDHESAASKFGRLALDDLFGGEARILEAFSLYFLGRYPEAVDALGAGCARGWEVCLRNAAIGRKIQGLNLEVAGTNPQPDYRQAVVKMNELVRRFPEEGATLKERAILYFMLARYLYNKGMDAEPDADLAIKDFDDVLRVDPLLREVYSLRADAYNLKALMLKKTGRNSLPMFTRSAADLDEYIKNFPMATDIGTRKAAVLEDIATAKFALGQDGLPHLASALAEHDRLVLEGKLPYRYFDRGKTHVLMVEAQDRAGADPDLSYAAAISDFREHLGKFPEHVQAVTLLGTSYLNRARRDANKEFIPDLKQAIVHFRRALELNPENPVLVRYNIAIAYSTWGDRDSRYSEDAYGKSLKELESAIAEGPKLFNVRALKGYVLLQSGRYEEGMALCEQILKERPESKDVREWMERARQRMAK